MIRILHLAIALLFFFPFFDQELNAQATGQGKERIRDFCGTERVHRELIENSDQGTVDRIREAEKKLEEGKNFQRERGTVLTIPVVFHIIHDGGPENISVDRVEKAMEVLNRDFRKQNADTSDIIPDFQNIASDTEVEFGLAQKDPDGNCHRGITRTLSDRTYDGDYNMKTLIQWDPSSYMNVWVCNDIDNGAAGYTIQPADANSFPNRDGIVLKYDYVGTQAPSSPSKSRILTHEVGHYLNLDHTWGSGQVASSCGNDGLDDTPETTGWQDCNGGDPANASTCAGSGPDNIQNYMDYSYCHKMFTEDQDSAMRLALNSSVADRNQLWSQSNLQETGISGSDILCKARFNTEMRTICVGESIDFTDRSYHGPTSWNWQFEGGNADDASSQNPSVTYSDTGTFDITLTAGNGSSTVSITKEDHIRVLPSPGSELPWVDPLDWMDSLEAHPDYFVQNEGGDPVEWEHTREAGEGASDGSVRLENLNNSGGETDAFVTNTMDASQIPSGALELSFDVAYAKTSSGDDDELRVLVSTECGKNWTQVFSQSGTQLETSSPVSSPFIPEDGQWDRKNINTPFVGSIYNIPDLRFKFEFISDGGNNIYIDNINVYDENRVGIEERENDKAELAIHPNPIQNRGVVTLELSEADKVKIELFDILGERVRTLRPAQELQKGEHRREFDLSGLEAGPYFMKVRIGEEIRTRKLFKE